MRLKEEFTEAQRRFGLLSFYDKFEHIVVLILTLLIAVVIVFAIWNLALKIVLSIASSTFDPTDYAVFQAVFGMIFTVIIALEFKRSLLVVAEQAQRRPGPYRDLDRDAGHRAQAPDPRRWTCNRRAVRACGGHNRAWGRLLARARPGSIRLERAPCR